MISKFLQKGKASFIVGGQFGSCGKGAAAAWTAGMLWGGAEEQRRFNVVTCNAGAQAGHTSIHQGVKRVAFHLPTAPLIAPGSIIYLNAGSIIDPVVLLKEIRDNLSALDKSQLFIHPMAAVITDECKEAEGRPDSAQTRIASTRKGVGEALSRKVLRSGLVAKDHPDLKPFVRRIDPNSRLASGQSVLVEVPQGNSLSLNGKFYPHCTSRDCTVGQAMSDAAIHPSFVGPTMLVLRTYPIRVGNINTHDASVDLDAPQDRSIRGYSGDCYPDQQETTWGELGVLPEITTVTGRVRRVFTWSQQQVIDAMISARPEYVFLTHCDYVKELTEHGMSPEWRDIGWYHEQIVKAAKAVGLSQPTIVFANGPTTADARVVNSYVVKEGSAPK